MCEIAKIGNFRAKFWRCIFICTTWERVWVWRVMPAIKWYQSRIINEPFGIRPKKEIMYESFLKEFRTKRCACRQGRSDANMTVKQPEYSWENGEEQLSS